MDNLRAHTKDGPIYATPFDLAQYKSKNLWGPSKPQLRFIVGNNTTTQLEL